MDPGSLDGLELTTEDLEHMLWDRVLAEALRRSGKPTLVIKTPSNVLVWERIAACLAGRQVRLPAASPGRRGGLAALLVRPRLAARGGREHGGVGGQGLRYMNVVEEARQALPGLTVRYEELTASPEPVVRELCEFLGMPFEPEMLEYGTVRPRGVHARPRRQLAEHRSGRIQPPAPMPDEMPAGLAGICAAWGYPHPDNEPSHVG